MQHSTESASFHTISSHFWQIAPALLLRNLLFPDARQDLQKFLQPDLELELDFAFCFLTFLPDRETNYFLAAHLWLLIARRYLL